MNKTQIKFICAALLLINVVALPIFLFWWPGSSLSKVPIQGYIFIAEQNIIPLNSVVDMEICSQKELFQATNKNRKEKHPLSGVKVRLQGEKKFTITDERGFFELHDRRYNMENDFITIDIFHSGQQIRYPVIPALDLKNKDGKMLHIVNIKENGRVSVSYLNDEKAQAHERKQPVLMIHGFGPDFGAIHFIIKKNKWTQVQKIIEKDMDLDRFDVFIFEYPDDQDIMISSRELSCAVERLKWIYDKKVHLLAYSAGGLVCRHYSVSDWYLENSIEDILMIGTPNHGSDLAILHFDNDLEDGDGTASKEILTESDFLNALNNKTDNPIFKKIYRINSQLQNETGLNPSIRHAVIAGEVTQEIRTKMKQSQDELYGIAGEVAVFFDKLFNRNSNRDELMNRFEESYRQGNKSIDQIINEIPPGDFIVPLESSVIVNVPYVTIPFTHMELILPDDAEDIRYQLIKKFLLNEPLEGTEKQKVLKYL